MVPPRNSFNVLDADILDKCVIVATRPLLLSVLKERLDILGHPRDENWESFLAQTATVISTGIKSAIKTLEIMSSPYSVLGTMRFPVLYGHSNKLILFQRFFCHMNSSLLLELRSI